MSNTHFGEHMDCANCKSAVDNPIVCISHSRGFHVPALKCETNVILFIQKGKMLINSDEYVGVTLTEGQFILQAIASRLELVALTDVECIYFPFNNPELFCHERYEHILHDIPKPAVYTPLKVVPELQCYLNGLKLYVSARKICRDLLSLKRKEFAYILSRCYTDDTLVSLLHPLTEYKNSFQYVVLQNHSRAKTVEDLAEICGYTVTTFRRIFRTLFGEPAYEWMLRKRKEMILNDLYSSTESISVICFKYGFESLSHFSNFCKKNFNASPRNLRSKENRVAPVEKKEINHAGGCSTPCFCPGRPIP